MPRHIHFEYNRPGKESVSYDEILVADRPELKVLLLESYTGRNLIIGRSVVQERGAPIVWYVFPNTWHDIGLFHMADETFTGWYTNLCTPAQFHGDTATSTDLFLDLWVPVSGKPAWLDEDEFEQACASGALSDELRVKALEERRRIQSIVEDGSWPPRVAHELDLSAVRALVGRPLDRHADS